LLIGAKNDIFHPMRTSTNLLSAIVACLLFVAGCGTTSRNEKQQAATMPTITPGELTVVGALANELPEVAVNGAVYLTILNGTTQPVQLVAAQSDNAAQVTFHETINDNGIMRMVRAEAGFAIGTGEGLVFAPGEKHLMLEQLQVPLKAGESFSLTLTFDNAATITLTVPVMPLGGAETEPDVMDHGTMDMLMPTETQHDHAGD